MELTKEQYEKAIELLPDNLMREICKKRMAKVKWRIIAEEHNITIDIARNRYDKAQRVIKHPKILREIGYKSSWEIENE